MKADRIAEIGIDQEGSLFIRPAEQSFPFIYRAGREIGWDSITRRLFCPRPNQRSYRDWFRQLLAAVADEYGVSLEIDSATAWSGMAEADRQQIEAEQV